MTATVKVSTQLNMQVTTGGRTYSAYGTRDITSEKEMEYVLDKWRKVAAGWMEEFPGTVVKIQQRRVTYVFDEWEPVAS